MQCVQTVTADTAFAAWTINADNLILSAEGAMQNERCSQVEVPVKPMPPTSIAQKICLTPNLCSDTSSNEASKVHFSNREASDAKRCDWTHRLRSRSLVSGVGIGNWFGTYGSVGTGS